MTVLFISNEYPPDTGFGGIATYTSHIAEALVADGHQVQVICRSVSGEDQTLTQNGVVIHRIVPGPYTLPVARVFYPLRAFCYRYFPQSLVRLAWARSAGCKVTALVSASGPFDIAEYPECGAEGLFVKRSAATATVVRLHTPWEIIRRYDDLPGPVTDHLLQNIIERKAATAATACTSPSRALAGIMKKKWRLGAVTVYPNPLPVRSYSQTVGGDWLFTGRIERRKGVDLLLRAYAGARSRRPLPRLTLIGRPYGRMKNGMEYGEVIRRLIGAWT